MRRFLLCAVFAALCVSTLSVQRKSFLRSHSLTQTATATSDSGDIQEGCVTFYKDADFQGYFVKMCSELVSVEDVDLDRVSSVKLGGGEYVYALYRPGDLWVPTGDESNLAGDWVNSLDHAQAFAVGADCVLLFEHAHFEGESKEFCEDVASLVPSGWNDKMSGFILGSNVDTVTFFEHENFGGQQHATSTPNDYFAGGWNDKTTSLKITLKA
mmetsp:Transcript_6272/g.7079  ORF Transcript_6272/g.7079 Transcript_6272/m.7079 type:complete len:213 (-) Transcript_6272:118-756(-)